MRLIDESDVIRVVDKHTTDDDKLDEDISVILEEVKTAFDKKKVIEEMQETGVRFCVNVKCPEDCQNCEHGVLMKALIDIVGKGGIE